MAAPITLRSVLSILRKDVGIDNDVQRVGQLAWMVFLKALDDRETEQEIVDERYRSPIPERFRWRSFVANQRLDGAALLAFVNDELFPGLSSLPGHRDPTAMMLRDVFRVAENRMKSPGLLRAAIDALNGIDPQSSLGATRISG